MNRDEAKAFAKRIGAEHTNTKLTRASVEITVHRAETNTDENYGLVSYYHRNPLKHYPVNFWIWLRGKYRSWPQF